MAVTVSVPVGLFNFMEFWPSTGHNKQHSLLVFTVFNKCVVLLVRLSYSMIGITHDRDNT